MLFKVSEWAVYYVPSNTV